MQTTGAKKAMMLVDTRLIRLDLVEKNDGGKVCVRGEFARAGEATENKRVYPKKVWEREIGRLDKPMKERRVFGEIDHPLDGRTSLSRVSHIVTEMRLEDGVLVGEAEILPTDKGKNLMALLKSGCKVGVSSRGYGSTKANDKGEEVVQEDYRLVTFDFVADPADQTAYPEVFFEGVEIAPMLTKAQENQKAKEWADRIQAAAKAEEAAHEAGEAGEAGEADKSKLADDLLTRLAELRAEVREEVRGELLSDPSVAGARTALDQIKDILRPFVLPEDAESVVKSKETEIARLRKECAERDLKIKDLETENGKLAEAAKEAGYKLYLERQLAGDPDGDLIKRVVGDVTKFENATELKAKLAGVREELSKKRETDKKVEETKVREVSRARTLAREATEKAEEKVEALSEAVEKLTAVNKAISLRLYVEKKLQSNPRSAKIRSLIESAKPDSKEEVDEIFENFSPAPPKDDDEAALVRSRIRSLTRGGSEGNPIDEETPRRSKMEEDYNGLGVDLGELKRLSGVRK
jgi:hypothetical protein